MTPPDPTASELIDQKLQKLTVDPAAFRALIRAAVDLNAAAGR